MKKNPTSGLIALCLLLAPLAGAQQQPASPVGESPTPLPRALETQLALSALPPQLRDNATVYVLNPRTGFEVAHQGTNGFYALVARTGDDTFRGTWPLQAYRDDILYPISFDAAGAKSNMRIFLDAAAMQAQGTPPAKLKQVMQARLQAGYYKPPDRAGVSYMLSPILRTYVNPDQNDDVVTSNIPHVMYYAPNVSNQDIGGAFPPPDQVAYYIQHGRWQQNPYPFIILHGPHGYMVQFRDASQRDAITRQYQPILAQLCQIKTQWCLPK